MKDKFDLKYIETESSYSDKEFQSLIEKTTKEFPQNKFFNYLISKKRNNKPVELTGMKNFPTYFFITFILVVSILCIKFVPNFIGFANKNYKIENFSANRHSIKYFSDYFKELDLISKIILVISQTFLLTISLSVSSIFLNKSNRVIYNRMIYYATNISSFLSTMSLVILSLFSEVTKSFSTSFNLVDDVTFFIYTQSTISLAILLFTQVKRINCPYDGFDLINEKLSILKQKKFYFILLMIVEVFLYSFCLLLLSYYNPFENSEKFAQFLLILCLNIISIIFLVTWALFILNLNSDFADVLINLEYHKTNEYYIDLDDDNKNVL